MQNSTEQYIPGVCNIGAHEVGKRTRLAITGIVLGFLYALAIYYFSLERPYRLLMFVPAMMAALGFLQARNRFCAVNGFYGESLMGNKKIKEEALAKDRNRAIKIFIYAILISAFVTTIIYYFPV
ncbi:MAG: hypothetical protein EOP53_03275 [Sphingobacteriales bacterium]|nr:MAG: hypothetical protein EOP53_03275 [Sphingobacteriales bacterium]